MPEPSKNAVLALTPVALITKSADRLLPLSSSTDIASPASLMAVILVDVSTLTPFSTHHFSNNPPAFSSSIRGTIRSSISITLRFTPRLTKASRIIQPIKPAPISTTFEPAFASDAMCRASSNVQHECTLGKSTPSIGGDTG